MLLMLPRYTIVPNTAGDASRGGTCASNAEEVLLAKASALRKGRGNNSRLSPADGKRDANRSATPSNLLLATARDRKRTNIRGTTRHRVRDLVCQSGYGQNLAGVKRAIDNGEG